MLLRHGQAQPESEQAGDFERSLTARGEAEAAAAGARIAALGAPDVLLASPAERTRRTALIVARLCGVGDAAVRFEPALYLATPATIWEQLARHGNTAAVILICGHNPGLSQLAGRLHRLAERIDLPTAGLACAEWHVGEWRTVQPDEAERCAHRVDG
jgi:phosphohistidine phosphatase